MYFCIPSLRKALRQISALITLVIPLSLFSLSTIAGSLQSPAACEENTNQFPCAVLVSGDDIDLLNLRLRKSNLTVRHRFHNTPALALQVSNASQYNRLKSMNVILIPDRAVFANAPPSGKGKNKDSNSGQITPSGVQRIGAAPGVLPYTGQGVGVAIVDTGVDLPNLDLNVAPTCFDAYDGNCQDLAGHGTHVAGIVAAKNNNLDVVGVAPDAMIYAVKVLGDNGSGTDSSIMLGLDWILQNANALSPPIRVINMSLGRSGTVDDNPLLHDLVQQLASNGITVVVAAGNDPAMEVSGQIPAAYPEVISVASTTAVDGGNKCRLFSGVIAADTASSFTTDGAGISISAPGSQKEDVTRGCRASAKGIVSLLVGGGTTQKSGTSMAAPHVAGVAALLYASGQYNDPTAIRAAIQTFAAASGSVPYDSPTSAYTFDGVREGVLSACGSLGVPCP